MKTALIALAVLCLAGCSDLKLADAQARHRAYACSHQTAAFTAANIVLASADRIRNVTLRAAAIAAANAELDLLSRCPARPVSP